MVERGIRGGMVSVELAPGVIKANPLYAHSKQHKREGGSTPAKSTELPSPIWSDSELQKQERELRKLWFADLLSRVCAGAFLAILVGFSLALVFHHATVGSTIFAFAVLLWIPIDKRRSVKKRNTALFVIFTASFACGALLTHIYWDINTSVLDGNASDEAKKWEKTASGCSLTKMMKVPLCAHEYSRLPS